MRTSLIFACVLLGFFAVFGISADCGCLQCSKNLRVVSHPTSPIKVIYRGSPCQCSKPIPYRIEAPVIKQTPCKLRDYCYKCHALQLEKPTRQAPLSSYNYQVQMPVERPQPVRYIYGLVASPDRIVLPAQGCEEEKPCGVPKTPIFESIKSLEDEDVVFGSYGPCTGCTGCSECSRYGSRSKRELSASAEDNIERNIREVFFGEAPGDEDDGVAGFRWKSPVFKVPLRKSRFLRGFDFSRLPRFTSRIKIGGGRSKRELPMYRVSGANPKLSDLFYDTVDWDNIFPQIPLFFFINAPVRMLKHFHKLREHFEPVVDCVPRVLDTSKRYLLDFGRKFKRSAVDFAHIFMGRVRRSVQNSTNHQLNNNTFINHLELLHSKINNDGSADLMLYNKNSKFPPEVILIYENLTTSNPQVYLMAPKTSQRYLKTSKTYPRNKRDLMALIKENDILSTTKHSEEDLFEKHFNSIPKLRKHFEEKHGTKMRVVFEKLDQTPEEHEERVASSVHNYEQVEHFDPEKNVLMIKTEIATLLDRIHVLIHTDFTRDVKISTDLHKMQFLLDTLVKDWKKMDKSRRSKLNILNYVSELERFKDQICRDIVQQLRNKNSFNRRNLINNLVNLYRLQVIFLNVSEDFSEKIKTGAKFHEDESSYLTRLAKIKLVTHEKQNVEVELQKTRDEQLQLDMDILHKLKSTLSYTEINDEKRDAINELAHLLVEDANLRRLQASAIKELSHKKRWSQNYRKQLKAVYDLQKHIDENVALLRAKGDEEKELADEEVVGQKPKSTLKDRLEEFVKSFEAKRTAWFEKNKIVTWKPKIKELEKPKN